MKKCSYTNCGKCELFATCKGCRLDDCLFQRCDGFCKNCPGSCWRRDLDFGIKDLSELKTHQQIARIPNLNWIPVIRRDKIFKKISANRIPFVIIRLTDIYNRGRLRTLDLHDYFHLQSSTKIIISWQIPDKFLEEIWNDGQINKGLRKDFGKLNCNFMLGPNFSNYLECPKRGYYYNIYRSIKLSNILYNLGIKMILEIASPCLSTHKFYANLLMGYTNCTVSFNCQMVRTTRAKMNTLERFKFFHENIDPSINFLISGLSGREDSAKIYKVCYDRNLIFSNSTAFLRAVCGRTLEKQRVDAERELLFILNVDYYKNIHQTFANAN